MISIFQNKKQTYDEEFDELFRSSYPSLYRHAYALLHNKDDSRDVVSEVFVTLLEKRLQLEGINIRYLTAMVHNRCLDQIKAQKVKDEARQEMAYSKYLYTETEGNREERMKDVLQFIDTELSPQTSRILRMCYDEKKSYKEVASELDISIQAVNKHISQALKKLRNRFNPLNAYGKRQQIQD